MSQSSANNNDRERRDSSHELSSEVTLESIQQTMTQNFAKIFETLDLIIHGQAMMLSAIMFFSNNNQPMQEETPDMDQNGFQQQHPVEMPPSPPISSPSKSVPDDLDQLGTGSSPTVRCADCGQAFIRKKSNESITHHAKNTPCKPFQCGECKHLFKTVSSNYLIKLI